LTFRNTIFDHLAVQYWQWSQLYRWGRNGENCVAMFSVCGLNRPGYSGTRRNWTEAVIKTTWVTCRTIIWLLNRVWHRLR